MKINCLDQSHINRQLTHICAAEVCKSRLMCPLCLKEHPNHGTQIDINLLNSPNIHQYKWCQSKIQHIMQFIQQNDQSQVHPDEIEAQVTYIVQQFIQEIQTKLIQVQQYLIAELQLKARIARDNFEYLKRHFINTHDLTEIGISLQKFKNGIYSKEAIDEILKGFFNKVHGNTEIQNIYNYMSQGGLNHNYLDLIQLDLNAFHGFKTKILSHFAKVEDFQYLLPAHHQEPYLPMKTHPVFSWHLINSYNETSQLSKLDKFTKINQIQVFWPRIIAVIDENKIACYKSNGQLITHYHKCQSNDFYLAVHLLNHNTQLFTLWSQPQAIQIYLGGKKIKSILDAASNPIKQLIPIQKYHLYQSLSQTCILTLDTSGTIQLNHIQSNYLYEFSYGSGIQEVQVLPDTCNALKTSISHSQEALFDYIVCSYNTNRIKLHVRSLFRSLHIQKIQDDETFESKLGFTEHCTVHFKIFKLSTFEKNYINKQMDIEGINYVIVTLLNNIVTIWNWRSGMPIRVLESGESYGIQVMPSIQTGLVNQIVLIGLEGRIHCLNWISQHFSTCRFKLGQSAQIYQMSEYFNHQSNDQNQVSFIIALRQHTYPLIVMSYLNYY